MFKVSSNCKSLTVLGIAPFEHVKRKKEHLYSCIFHSIIHSITDARADAYTFTVSGLHSGWFPGHMSSPFGISACEVATVILRTLAMENIVPCHN